MAAYTDPADAHVAGEAFDPLLPAGDFPLWRSHEDDIWSSAAEQYQLAPIGQKSFRTHLRKDYLAACSKTLTSKQVATAYVEMLKERAQLEMEYAAGLEKIAQKVEPDCRMPSSSLSKAMMAEKALLVGRAEQCRQLSMLMKDDVLPDVEASEMEHTEQDEAAGRELARLRRLRTQKYDEHDDHLRMYVQSCADADAGSIVYLTARDMMSKRLIAKKMISQCNTATSAEWKYLKAVGACNAVDKDHQEIMTVLLNTKETMELKRAACLRTAMLKMARHNLAWIRKVQYDYQAQKSTFNHVDPYCDLQKFIELQEELQNETRDGVQLEERPVEFFVWLDMPHILENAYDLNPPDLLRQPVSASGAYIELMLENFWSNNGQQDLDGNSSVHMVFDIDNPEHRASFCRYLKERCDRPLTLSTLSELATMVLLVLDACDTHFDVVAGLALMLLSEEIYAPFGGGDQRVLLRTKITDHRLWRRADFWRECVMVSVAEDLMNTALKRRPRSNTPATSPFNVELVSELGNHARRFGILPERACEWFAAACEENDDFGSPSFRRRLLAFNWQ